MFHDHGLRIAPSAPHSPGPYSTQCSAQPGPSCIPITGLIRPPTPSLPSLCFPESVDSSRFVSHSDFHPLHFPLLKVLHAILTFHEYVKLYDDCLSLLDLFHWTVSSNPIHVGADGGCSSFLMAEQYAIVYVDHMFSNHTAVKGHLQPFPVKAELPDCPLPGQLLTA